MHDPSSMSPVLLNGPQSSSILGYVCQLQLLQGHIVLNVSKGKIPV